MSSRRDRAFPRPLSLLTALLVTALSWQAALAQTRDNAVILMYHHVSTATPPSTSISPEAFRAQMDYLRDQGFVILPLEDMLASLRRGEPLPERAAALSFDDAYLSVYEEAFPLLKDYGWPFTVFINPGLVDSNRRLYASWEMLNEMGGQGATLANHTVSHPYLLERLDGEDKAAWLGRLRREIEDAEAEIARRTGQNHRLLAYPYGEYDADIQALVRELGYIGLGQQSGPINSSSDFSALPRFPFGGIHASMNSFPTKVSSLAFNIDQVLPENQVTRESGPAAELQLLPGDYRLAQLGCFNNDQPIQVSPLPAEGAFRVTTHVENKTRRFRYNCTAPGPEGRFYWYSIPFVNPDIPE